MTFRLMTDTLTSEYRSLIMSRIKSTNTKPEIIVRKILHRKGLRFRLNQRNLPGTPDIVLAKYKTVIFINGCFWHGHDYCRKARLPKSNVEFWQKKISKTKARDVKAKNELEAHGWQVYTIWECEVASTKTIERRICNLADQIKQNSTNE